MCVQALGLSCEQVYAAAQNVAPRPPALCKGCGHRDVYDALNKSTAAEYPDAKIFGDIGCYTLGALPPFRTLSSCVDMGAIPLPWPRGRRMQACSRLLQSLATPHSLTLE